MVILKIDGVVGQYPGNPCEADLQNGIELSSINWGSSTQVSMSGGSLAAGTAQFDRISFSKMMDKASGSLMKMCATGEKINGARIYYVRAGGTSGLYVTMKIDCKNLVVSGYSLNGSSGSDPAESVSLAVASIKFDYRQITESGQLGANVSGGWDISKSVPV